MKACAVTTVSRQQASSSGVMRASVARRRIIALLSTAFVCVSVFDAAETGGVGVGRHAVRVVGQRQVYLRLSALSAA